MGELLRKLSNLLNAQVLGNGPETLVLAHGFGCDQSSWQHLSPWLMQRYRVVVFDLACAGTVATEAFDMRRHGDINGYVDDLLTVLDDLEIDRCIYIGHSASGMIGLLASIRQPRRFEKVIAMGASARYRNDHDYIGGFDAPSLNAIFDAIEQNFRDWARSFAPIAVGRDVEDPATMEFTRSLLSLRPDIALVAAKTIFLGDWRAQLPACPVPTVILQSNNDPAVPAAAAEYLHRHLPLSEFELMDTKGHLPHLSAPYVVSLALRRYLPRFQPHGPS